MHPEAYAIVTLFCNPSFRLVSGHGSARSAFESVPLIASWKSDVASNARQAFLRSPAFAAFVVSPPVFGR